jgi:adenosylhomocysteine nucleosidase
MKLAIQICSELEWETTKSILKITKGKLHHQPFGGYFEHQIGRQQGIYYQSGATKTRAAAACQFVIDTLHPDAVVNLGTCGGVAENVRKLDIILANKTFQYDVIQRFGTPSIPFKKSLKTDLKISWIDLSRVSDRLHIGTIASADQDLFPRARKILQERGVLVADWESASIAKVCELNRTKCIVLRGVSDIPREREKSKGDIQELDYRKNMRILMKDLLSIIGQIDRRL